uniref:C2H2-type domain-containing protein n=2 Tax=Heliothis virescens TaxID=7102 RepID=A0A2A4K608_HELVI
MGAKTPATVNKQLKPRPTVKCEVCGRKFLTVSALKSHHKFLHMKPEALKQSKKQETTKLVKKKMLPANILRKVKPSVAPKEDKVSEAAESPSKVAGKSPSAAKRPEFECPVCAERFPVYFTTFRHIQKKHCVNEKGDKVSTNSPDLVKPIRIEMCASCSQQIRSTEPHKCPQQQSNKDHFCCLGCRQVFTGLVVFQHHVKGLHADGAQNYFFPTRDDFLNWKEDLEEQTMVKFVKLNKTKSKEIYHCSHQVIGQTSATDTCCSLITLREYTKGFHICYYKEHKGHKVDTSPLSQHSKYCISLYTQDKEEIKLEAEEDNELLTQFKKMISCILFDAANVSSNTLKELLGKALEMTSVLKHAEGQDRSTPLISKCLSDAQISKTLDSLKDPNKRKFPDDSNTKTVAKRARKSSHSVDKVVENGMATRHKNSLTVNKSVSFTDLQGSDDVENIIKEISPTPEKSATKQKSVPKKTEVTVTVEPKEEETKNKPDDAVAALRSQLQSPSSFNESYKNFVDQNFKVNTDVTSTPKTRANVKKKEVVKTKMGQFKTKSSVSPKTVSPKSPKEVVKEVPTTPRIRKPVLDIQYEVKEQENDCNILILKI